jgi:hypothetical protein
MKAHLEFDTEKKSMDSSWMLTPTDGNFHEILALQDSVMLDVLLPPYHDHDRPCKFYQSKREQSNYFLRPVSSNYIATRLRLPINVPYEGYQPAETS